MIDLQGMRGTGIRFTLPFVLRFSGLWLLVGVLTLLVFAVTSYLGLFDRLDDAGRTRFLVVLGIQTVSVILGMVGLAIFTTHRVAGPLIGIQRALDDVKAGNLERELHFRKSDRHLESLEVSFNEMMVAVRERIDERPRVRASRGESA